MNKLFNLTLGEPNDILGCEHPVVTASQCDDGYVLANADVPLIARSAFCKNNSKFMTREKIIEHDHINSDGVELADNQLVVFIPESSKYIAIEYIYDIETYIAVIEIVMKYDMSIAYFYTKCEYALWYIMIKEKSNDLWARNAKILSIDTSGVFEIKKLRVASSLPGNNGGNYPIATTQRRAQPVAKSIVLKPRDRFSSESFERLIELLIDTSAISILDKIIAIIGTSIDHFGIIWSNESIMELLHRYSTILPSVIWYNMRIMHLEYMSSIRTSTTAHRHIINGKVAALLPQSDVKNFTNSIYYTEILKNQLHKACLPSTFGNYRGIYLHNDFIERFNQFSGNSLNWIHDLNGEFELEVDDTTTSHKFYITGSIMAACLIKNPLEHGFDSLTAYFEEYYPSRYSTDPEFAKANDQQRDIDEEIEKSNLFDIIDTVEYQQEIDVDDVGDTDSDDNDEYDVDGKQKSVSEIEQLKIDDKYYGTTDIDIAVECTSFDTLTDIVCAMIDRIKQSCKQSITMTKTSNCRYAIDGLHRRIEVFMVKSGPSIIGSFHLPCVRAWYNGSDTFMFVDFITAAYTGINLNLFWTSSGKDARGIILKYYQRGFSMLLNHNDTSALIAYINAQDAWPNHQMVTGNYWARRRFKTLQIYFKDPGNFFNPSVYQHGVYANLTSIPTCIDLKSVKQSKFSSNIGKKISRRRHARSTNEFISDTRYIIKHGRKQGVYLPKLHPRLSKYL